MNLDDDQKFPQIDTQNMLAEIDGLPDQLQKAWELGGSLPLALGGEEIRQVLISGMGGSAIGADLLAAYIQGSGRVPVVVHRGYDLPAWARGAHTLVIASSHSGNTEETLSSFQRAQEAGCRCLAITTGGTLAEEAAKAGSDLWTFEHAGQPRAAVGFSFGLLLAAFSRLNLIPDPSGELAGAIAAMREHQASLRAGVPVHRNPAKRMAGQLIDRWVTVVGAEVLIPVARRWKGQINEVAKTWGQFDDLPEADHNTLAGIINPEPLLERMVALFLRAPSYHPRNRLRSDLTRQAFMMQGINTDFIDAHGDNPLAHQWTTLLFGDYMAYYLAMAYEVDPTPVEAIQSFKQELKAAGQ